MTGIHEECYLDAVIEMLDMRVISCMMCVGVCACAHVMHS